MDQSGIKSGIKSIHRFIQWTRADRLFVSYCFQIHWLYYLRWTPQQSVFDAGELRHLAEALLSPEHPASAIVDGTLKRPRKR